MTVKDTLRSSSAFFMPYGGSRSGMMPSFRPVFEAEGLGGGAGDNEEPPETTKHTKLGGEGDEKTARELARNKKALELSARSVTQLEEQLKRFEGIDPDQIKALLEEKAEAAKATKKLEEEKLRAAGDFEALKTRMLSEHQKELDAERKQASEIKKNVDLLTSQIHELTIGSAFAGSKFIQDDLLLPTRQARRAFEEYFEVKDGEIVAYDRPAKDTGRVPLVDSKGRNLPFDEAIKQIVEADPDRDRLMKSKQKPGSGQNPSVTRVDVSRDAGKDAPTGINAIALALAARKK
jgi:hypothetical protein